MIDLALDADAFNFLRKLELLADLVALTRPPTPRLSLHMTKYVARHELNSLAAELSDLERNGVLKIWPIASKSPAFKLFRELQDTYDKGESELAAWITSDAPSTVLVSCDGAVPDLAAKLKFDSLDLGQLVVVLVKDELITREAANDRLRPWENPHTGIGRPSWWSSLETALSGPHPLATRRAR